MSKKEIDPAIAGLYEDGKIKEDWTKMGTEGYDVDITTKLWDKKETIREIAQNILNMQKEFESENKKLRDILGVDFDLHEIVEDEYYD